MIEQPQIICDYRERSSGIPDQLEKLGVKVEFQQLDVGDYIISDQMAIERKTLYDFDSSVRDGRLSDQSKRLKNAYSEAILLLIRDDEQWGSLPEHGRMGALASTIRKGVSVVQARQNEEAAAVIYRLARHAKGKPKVRSAPKVKKGKSESALGLVQSLPGVGPGTAQNILDHFGSWQNIVAADVKELKKVEGIGKVRAQILWDIFHYDQNEWEENLDF